MIELTRNSSKGNINLSQSRALKNTNCLFLQKPKTSLIHTVR